MKIPLFEMENCKPTYIHEREISTAILRNKMGRTTVCVIATCA